MRLLPDALRDLDRARTCDRQIRNLLLYPTELPDRPLRLGKIRQSRAKIITLSLPSKFPLKKLT